MQRVVGLAAISRNPTAYPARNPTRVFWNLILAAGRLRGMEDGGRPMPPFAGIAEMLVNDCNEKSSEFTLLPIRIKLRAINFGQRVFRKTT